MSSPISIAAPASAGKYVPVHKRPPSSTSSSPMRQTPVSDASKRPPIYSIGELLQLAKSPLVQTSLTPEQKQGVSDVMAYIPKSRQPGKSRSPSPTKPNEPHSPTTNSKRAPSKRKAKRSPASETTSLPNVNTPPTPRRRSSNRRPTETNSISNPNADSSHQHHRKQQWGYAPSFHSNEDNWRAHPGVAIVA